MRNRRKNGEEFVERLTISTSYNEDGSVHSHIGLFADVSVRRTTAEEAEAVVCSGLYDDTRETPDDYTELFAPLLARRLPMVVGLMRDKRIDAILAATDRNRSRFCHSEQPDLAGQAVPL